MTWDDVSAALAATTDRLAELVAGLDDLDRQVVGTWTRGDVAAHLAHIYEFDALVAGGARTGIDDISAMPVVTAAMVAGETDRDPVALARRIRDAHDRLVAGATATGEAARDWIGGVALTPANLGAHVVSEALLHGYDLVRGQGRPWSMGSAECRLAVEGFLFPVLAQPASHDLVLDATRVAGVNCSYALAVRGGRPFYLDFADGKLTAGTDPTGSRVDCRISADARGLLLVIWGRSGQASQILRGRLLATGPKPWMGLRLNSFFRTI